MIVVPLLATVFNHAGYSDESPFFKTKRERQHLGCRSFLYIGLEPSINRGPRKVGDFLGRGGTCEVIAMLLLATVFNHAECSDESLPNKY